MGGNISVASLENGENPYFVVDVDDSSEIKTIRFNQDDSFGPEEDGTYNRSEIFFNDGIAASENVSIDLEANVIFDGKYCIFINI